MFLQYMSLLGLDPTPSELNGKVPPDASGAGNIRGTDITVLLAFHTEYYS